MRRMYSDGQVIKVVNKAIDDGEIVIEAGGLPEIEAGDAGKALVVNSEETGAEWGNVGISPDQKILVFNVNSASTSSVTASLTEDQKTFITTYSPLIKVNFTDISVLYSRYLLTDRYLGFCADASTSRNLSTLLDDSGNKVKVQDFYLYNGAIGTASIVFSREARYVLSGRPFYIVPTAETGITNVTSGSTITNSIAKNVIKSSGCFKVNGQMAYPMYRDTTNKISYYYNVISSSSNLVQTVYEINETTWVITFVTKTIQ